MVGKTIVGTEAEALIVQECKLKGYSQKTINSYLHYVKKFIKSEKQPREFLLALIEKHKSDKTVKSAGFAIRFYLNTIKKDSAEIQEILHPDKVFCRTENK